jgi:hypothetical protein
LDASPALLMLRDIFNLIFSLPVGSVFGLFGFAAIAIGTVRATVVGVDMA